MQEPSDFSAIYGIRHILSGKTYVGSAVKVKSRWKVHLNSLRKGKHHSKYLQNAWDKYGGNSFEFIILEIVSDKNLLLAKENIWINKLSSADNDYGFNMCLTAGSQLGMKRSKETRKKMSEAGKGKVKTESHQRAINESLTGRKLSDEHRKKISNNRKGTIASDETRIKMSESRKGRTASIESRKKMSDALTLRHIEARSKGLRITGVPLKKTNEGIEIDKLTKE